MPIWALGIVFSIGSLSAGQPVSTDVFERALAAFGADASDVCGAAPDLTRQQSAVFDAAARELADSLNADPRPSDAAQAQTRITAPLNDLERASARANAAWPDEARFHGDASIAWPLVTARFVFRQRWAMYVFARTAAKPEWRLVGPMTDGSRLDTAQTLELFPIQRGPSGRARMLARTLLSGCAGSVGLAYELYEWDPVDDGWLVELLSIDGAETWGDVREFPAVGALLTDGPTITLPYCWFSAIDTWDNPSLCAADTYDVSGDVIRFRGRVTNRPDLYPIARAIQYAQTRDDRAVSGYCRSAKVARRLVRDIPDDLFAGTLTVRRLSGSKERVTLDDDSRYVFDVERHAGVWAVARMSVRR